VSDLLILAQSVIDEGFFADCGTGCIFTFAAVGAVLIGLGLLIGRTKRRAEDDYWRRRRIEEERRLNDPDMAKPDEDLE
jgi:hypothetical protein